MKNPVYFVRFKPEYDSVPKAEADMEYLSEIRGIRLESMEIGYYIPQPQYKKWVPNWLIRFITKKS